MPAYIKLEIVVAKNMPAYSPLMLTMYFYTNYVHSVSHNTSLEEDNML